MANAPGPSRDDHDPGGDAAAAPDHPEELDAAELAGLDADRPDEAGQLGGVQLLRVIRRCGGIPARIVVVAGWSGSVGHGTRLFPI